MRTRLNIFLTNKPSDSLIMVAFVKSNLRLTKNTIIVLRQTNDQVTLKAPVSVRLPKLSSEEHAQT